MIPGWKQKAPTKIVRSASSYPESEDDMRDANAQSSRGVRLVRYEDYAGSPAGRLRARS